MHCHGRAAAACTGRNLEKEFGECQRSTQYEGKSGREKRQGNLEKTQLNLEKIRTTDRKMENVFGEAKRLMY